MPGSPADQAERRQLTVLFCDLVGSTTLSAALDPEDLREVIRAYQAACGAAVERFEGHIAQYLGDGLLVYFGYPVAHESGAQRAVRAALHMLWAVEQLNPRLQSEFGLQIAVRVGIHTGLVVAGEVGAGATREQLALGETPNVAARVQGAAEPNTVLVSAATYRLARGFFEWRDLGPRELKGLPQPLPLYQALGESAARSRLDVAAAAGLTPLGGRKAELQLLLECWAQAAEGHGQAVSIMGEAGIGKSRLALAVAERVASDRAQVRVCLCSPYHRNTAFYPIVDMLERDVLGFAPNDPPESKLRKLERWLAEAGVDLSQAMPLLTALLSLPLREPYAALALAVPPQRQQQQTMDLLVHIVFGQARQEPMLFVVEDLHWADPSTLELLNRLVKGLSLERFLALFTSRPDAASPWGTDVPVAKVTIDRLTKQPTADIVAWIAGHRTLPSEVLERVITKTDGIPLFVEELTRAVLESGLLREAGDHYDLVGKLDDIAIPDTLYDSLLSRLDRLGLAKQLAQTAAAVGRVCNRALLAAISGLTEVELDEQLARLVDAELVDWPVDDRGHLSLAFRHALIQDAAYRTMLRTRRRAIHSRIADVLLEQFPESVRTEPEILAQHLTAAGRSQEAVDAWLRAGERAAECSAPMESIAHLDRGLQLLESVLADGDRDLKELRLQIRRGGMLRVSRGIAAPETAAAFQHARDLCHRLGDDEQLIPTLTGLYSYYLVHAEYDPARDVAEELLATARAQGSGTSQMIGHRAVGAVLFATGQPVAAAGHLAEALRRYNVAEHAADAFLYGTDHAEIAASFLALSLWVLGKPDTALARQRWAVAHSEQLDHAPSLAQALTYLCLVGTLARDWPLVERAAPRLREVAGRIGFGMLQASVPLWEGAVAGFQGNAAEGARLLREANEAISKAGVLNYQPFNLALLAEILGDRGSPEEGLPVLRNALLVSDRTNERWADPELYRVRGRLLGQAGRPVEAEAELQRALDLARTQGARMWELRSAAALAAMWRDGGRRAEARRLLEQALVGIDASSTCYDVAQATALLASLAGGSSAATSTPAS